MDMVSYAVVESDALKRLNFADPWESSLQVEVREVLSNDFNACHLREGIAGHIHSQQFRFRPKTTVRFGPK
jgi:hypothetical protein